MSRQELVDYLYRVADEYGIDRDIAYKQIQQESGFNPLAKSPAGAEGIAQFTKDTGLRFGLLDRFDPIASLNAWGQYMSELLEKFDYRYDLALAGYNSGEYREEYSRAYNEDRGINWSVLPRRVQNETRNYVRIILGDSDRPYYASEMDSGSGNQQDISRIDSGKKSGSQDTELIILALGGLGILLFLIVGGSSR